MGYSISWEKYGAVCVYGGAITFDELVAALTSLHRHADYDQLKFAIHDFLGVTELRPGQTDLSILVAHTLGASYSNPHIRTAIVAVLPELVKVAQQYAERTRQKVRTFSTIEEARAWLREANPAS